MNAPTRLAAAESHRLLVLSVLVLAAALILVGTPVTFSA